MNAGQLAPGSAGNGKGRASHRLSLQSLQRQINTLTMEIANMSGMQSQLDQAIPNLQQQVTAETNATTAAVTLLNGVPQMINDAVQKALAAGATPAVTGDH